MLEQLTFLIVAQLWKVGELSFLTSEVNLTKLTSEVNKINFELACQRLPGQPFPVRQAGSQSASLLAGPAAPSVFTQAISQPV